MMKVEKRIDDGRMQLKREVGWRWLPGCWRRPQTGQSSFLPLALFAVWHVDSH
jgi:hypothetical protein